MDLEIYSQKLLQPLKYRKIWVHVPVVQWIEHLVAVQAVGGSTPLGHAPEETLIPVLPVIAYFLHTSTTQLSYQLQKDGNGFEYRK